MPQMTRTIIGLWGRSDIGKSTTLSRLGSLLSKNGEVLNGNLSEPDYRATIEYGSKLIGIQTFGDYPTAVADGLNHFKTSCDLLVMATRSSGGTVTQLQAFAKKHHYRLIWATPLELEGSYAKGHPLVKSMKDYSAAQLAQMIDDIILGKL